MPRNTVVLDRGVGGLLVAPVAIVVAFILGARTIGGVMFLVAYTLIGICTHPRRFHRRGHQLRGGHACWKEPERSTRGGENAA